MRELCQARGAQLTSFAQLKHAQDRFFRSFAHRLGQSDLGFHVQQSIVSLLQRVHLHEAAFTAKAIVCRARNECLTWDFFAQSVQQASFGYHNDLARGRSLWRSEEHTSELQSRLHLVCRLLLEKKNNNVPHSSCCTDASTNPCRDVHIIEHRKAHYPQSETIFAPHT